MWRSFGCLPAKWTPDVNVSFVKPSSRIRLHLYQPRGSSTTLCNSRVSLRPEPTLTLGSTRLHYTTPWSLWTMSTGDLLVVSSHFLSSPLTTVLLTSYIRSLKEVYFKILRDSFSCIPGSVEQLIIYITIIVLIVLITLYIKFLYDSYRRMRKVGSICTRVQSSWIFLLDLRKLYSQFHKVETSQRTRFDFWEVVSNRTDSFTLTFRRLMLKVQLLCISVSLYIYTRERFVFVSPLLPKKPLDLDYKTR